MMPGTGGTPTPPPGYQPPQLPGVAAGSVNIFRGRLVIVTGPSGAVVGVFVYAAGTTPGLGNPPVFWATSSSADPFGNAIAATAGISGTGTFQAGTTLITPQGVITYAALPPAANGLVSSSGVPAAFTDSAGNAVLAGNTSYIFVSGSTYLAASEQSGALVFYVSTTGQAGPWSATVQANGATTAADHSLYVGKQDGNFYRVRAYAPTLLADPGIWQDLRPLANSFVGTIASRYPPQCRFLPDGNVQVAGYVQTPAGATSNYNGLTFATVPAYLKPGSNTGHAWPVKDETNFTLVGTPNVQVDTSGNLQIHNFPTTGLGSHIINIGGIYPLDGSGLILV